MFIFASYNWYDTILMGRKAEERERRRERSKRIVGGLSCALTLILIADVFTFIVAGTIGDM